MLNKVIIVGNGFVGKNLFKYFSAKYSTQLTNRLSLDLSDETSIKNYFSSTDHTHIIYAAGIKDIKYCETNTNEALEINSLAINRILRYSNANSKFIYISTDYVFDGKLGNYKESDKPNPLTVYGQSKLLGEQITSYATKNSIIIRTSGLYGSGCPWMGWLLTNLKNNNKVECYSNVINSPTYVMNLAEMVDDVCMSQSINFSGIIHLSGQALNRYDLYYRVARSYHMDESLLYSGLDKSYFPNNISLDTSLYTSITNKKPDDIIIGLERLQNEN